MSLNLQLLRWKLDDNDPDRWYPDINGVRPIGLDVTRNADGKWVALGDVYDSLSEAQHYVEVVLEIHDALDTDYSRAHFQKVVMHTVQDSDGRLLYLASTPQRAAEWALNNGHVASPIVEVEVDS